MLLLKKIKSLDFNSDMRIMCTLPQTMRHLVHRFRPTSRVFKTHLSKELYKNSLFLTDFLGFPVSNDVFCAG